MINDERLSDGQTGRIGDGECHCSDRHNGVLYGLPCTAFLRSSPDTFVGSDDDHVALVRRITEGTNDSPPDAFSAKDDPVIGDADGTVHEVCSFAQEQRPPHAVHELHSAHGIDSRLYMGGIVSGNGRDCLDDRYIGYRGIAAPIAGMRKVRQDISLGVWFSDPFAVLRSHQDRVPRVHRQGTAEGEHYE